MAGGMRRYGKYKFHRFFVFLILILIIISIISFPTSASGERKPDFDFFLEENVIWVDVKPGEHGYAQFLATVRMNSEITETINIRIRSRTSEGWSSTVEPEELSFTKYSANNLTFLIDVRVPSETIAFTKCNVEIFGSLFFQNLNDRYALNNLDGTIITNQFHKFTLSSSRSYQESAPGNEFEFDIRIKNQGNGEDIFYYEVQNIEDLTEKGFDVEQSSGGCLISPKDEVQFSIRVATPLGLDKTGIHKIILQVSTESNVSSGGVSRTFPLTIRLRYPGLNACYVSMIITLLISIIIILYLIKRTKSKKYHR